MSETEALVKSYLGAVAARDFDLARTFLADRGFNYNSPIAAFNDADRFIESITAVGQILERLVIRKCIVSGDEAIAIVDSTLTLNGYEAHVAAILFVIKDGYIKSMEAIFDASDYHQMFSGDD